MLPYQSSQKLTFTTLSHTHTYTPTMLYTYSQTVRDTRTTVSFGIKSDFINLISEIKKRFLFKSRKRVKNSFLMETFPSSAARGRCCLNQGRLNPIPVGGIQPGFPTSRVGNPLLLLSESYWCLGGEKTRKDPSPWGLDSCSAALNKGIDSKSSYQKWVWGRVNCF